MTKYIIFRLGEFDFKSNILTCLALESLESCAAQINKAKGSEMFLKIRDGNKIVGKVLRGTAEVVDDILVAEVQWTAEKFTRIMPEMQRVLAGFRVRR